MICYRWRTADARGEMLLNSPRWPYPLLTKITVISSYFDNDYDNAHGYFNDNYGDYLKNTTMIMIMMRKNYSQSNNLEPVDSAAIYKRREHSQSVSKSISNWTHCQYNMEVLSDSFNEESVHC